MVLFNLILWSRRSQVQSDFHKCFLCFSTLLLLLLGERLISRKEYWVKSWSYMDMIIFFSQNSRAQGQTEQYVVEHWAKACPTVNTQKTLVHTWFS
jgi:hypothetical protein